MDEYIVYAQIDDAGRITAIASSLTLHDAAGWTEIDRGQGDRYAHAAGNYLDGPLADELGVYLFAWDGESVRERAREDVEAERAEITRAAQLAALKARRNALLADTDWTQVLDAPVDAPTREAMRIYRQALRDIPEQAGYPDSVEWPEYPGTAKAAADPVDTAFDILVGGDGA